MAISSHTASGSNAAAEAYPSAVELTQIAYVSAATHPFSSGQLRALLCDARNRNQTRDITGILIYHQGSFLQVFEGPSATTAKLFNSIERDPRHAQLRIIHRSPVARREYQDWSMGFVDLGSLSGSLGGYVDFSANTPLLALDQSRTRRLLALFVEEQWQQQVGR